ncbi:hypothetical protein TNCT_633211 [Trichonephila clavata]|uniref:Uncharacterized protein n=1 Tax=Trichonephila clavata TaxID=2740835 RepID=A0A8X6FF89_TRICU|nr:hypothetical protein TNCT_633211 [Trichonephila clavata]
MCVPGKRTLSRVQERTPGGVVELRHRERISSIGSQPFPAPLNLTRDVSVPFFSPLKVVLEDIFYPALKMNAYLVKESDWKGEKRVRNISELGEGIDIRGL